VRVYGAASSAGLFSVEVNGRTIELGHILTPYEAAHAVMAFVADAQKQKKDKGKP
jgi:hypothetical protein